MEPVDPAPRHGRRPPLRRLDGPGLDLQLRTVQPPGQPHRVRPLRAGAVLRAAGPLVASPRPGAVRWPILIAMWAWEGRWAPAWEAPLPTMHHPPAATTPPAWVPVVRKPGRCPRRRRRVPVPSGDWSRSVPTSVGAAPLADRGVQPSELLPRTMELFGKRVVGVVPGCLVPPGAHRFATSPSGPARPRRSSPTACAGSSSSGNVKLARMPSGRIGGPINSPRRGLAFFPVVILMIAWGQDWSEAPEGPALVLTHTACGGPFHPELLCGTCGQPLTSASIGVR